jgi:hypothetical protein
VADEPSLAPHTVINRTDTWLTAKVGDEVVMMNASTGHYIGLTETGGRIWDLLESSSTLEELCARLMQEYDVALEQARSDVVPFLQELSKHGAVSLDNRCGS